ncbi:MAG: ABC transporter permease [Alphaproteobacteria bacterium]|nr:ABC transporter permease [Alphaproteobacteria bacterium]
MFAFIVGRILAAIPVLVIVSLLTFVIIYFVPGDVASELAGPTATPDEIEQIRDRLGLNQPFVTRLVSWYGALLQGDLGHSFLLNQTVSHAILERLPVTLSVTAYALVIVLLIGMTTGIIAAVRANTWVDQGMMGIALIGLSLPDFWLGLVMIYVFAVVLGWMPTGGYVEFSESPLGWLRMTTMPALSLALTQVGLLARMTRSGMLEVLRQDYVRTARAKGLPGWMVVGKHALANVMVQVVTVVGVSVGILLGGQIVIESVFSLPGVGRLIVGAILRRDYPVIQGGLLLTATIFVVVNLIVDLLYAYFDPRIRYGR